MKLGDMTDGIFLMHIVDAFNVRRVMLRYEDAI